MADTDNPQLSLGNIIANLPAVRAAKKINPMSRVHKRLIEPLEGDLELAFQHSVFCQTSLPYLYRRAMMGAPTRNHRPFSTQIM